MLVIKYDHKANDEVLKVLADMKYALKNKIVIKDNIELTVEMKLKADDTEFVSQLSKLEEYKVRH